MKCGRVQSRKAFTEIRYLAAKSKREPSGRLETERGVAIQEESDRRLVANAVFGAERSLGSHAGILAVFLGSLPYISKQFGLALVLKRDLAASCVCHAAMVSMGIHSSN